MKTKFPIKKENINDARKLAQKISKETNGTAVFVIYSDGIFYIDNSSFTRTWETLQFTFVNGVQA